MGSAADHRGFALNDPGNPLGGVVGADRISDPGGRPGSFTRALCAGVAQQALLPAVDGRPSLDRSSDARKHPDCPTIRPRNVPGAWEPLGDSNDALYDVGDPSGSTTQNQPFVDPATADIEERGKTQGNAMAASALARGYLASRRQRDELLGADLFADPAWDILLDLFASEVEGRKISVSSACMAGAVPCTTALGWLVKLERRGLLSRARDPNDGRRTFLRLSPAAFAAIEKWLIAAFA